MTRNPNSEEVYEVENSSASPGFDISVPPPPPPTHSAHKAKGNEAFKLENYKEAIEEFSIAYSSPTCDDVFKSVVLANRSASYGALKQVRLRAQCSGVKLK